jgi:hypothetical protein
VPVPVGSRGRALTGPRNRAAAAECQWRIDGQRPVTEWGGTSAVSGWAQVGIPVTNGYLRAGGLDFAARRIDGDGSVCLIPGRAAAAFIVEDRCTSCGVGHLQTIWGAGRPGWEEGPVVPIVLMDLHCPIDDCAFVGRSRTAEPTVSTERWFLSICVRFVASSRPVMHYAKEASDITRCSAIGLLPQRASLATVGSEAWGIT